MYHKQVLGHYLQSFLDLRLCMFVGSPFRQEKDAHVSHFEDRFRKSGSVSISFQHQILTYKMSTVYYNF